MKGIINKLVIAFAMMTISNAAFGYTWEFANHTDKDIEVKLFLAAGPSAMKKIVAGEQESLGWEVPDFYAGFCSAGLQYREVAKGPRAAWREVNVQWIPSNALDTLLEATSQIGSGAQSVAIAGAKMGAAAQTGGASELGASAEALKGSAARKVTAQAGQQRARGETTAAIADAAGNADLGGFISGMGKAISVSSCRGRHFEIFSDDNGIYFTTLQQ